jgi:putative FmdB family regulatory protein
MPIYAYKCESCAHAKDVLQKISDPLLTVCPACGQATFKKQLTAAGFQLKGSGWYVTDFKGGAKEGEGAKSDGAASTAATPAAASSASAPAAASGASSATPAATSSSASTATSSPSAPAAKSSASPASGV